ncbi:hypothetical protein [Pelagovum pacificum]|uniref:Dienelactone hydrolase n=1 Tax=Pelagovum pacificum TaxID=2588711 RepID=A0A5C5GKC5_9RHOB|nr:hypothetical protein [Pelagovum pacificum]QQA42951.1 hypothetical protein I8N54_19620 [Pelagovum pacificum]TNY33906.1 hypothetical protein FHY64_11770 [Pelagovum pacificum]
MKTLLVIALLLPLPAFAQVGHTRLDAGDSDRPLALSLWYPATEGEPEMIGGNAVFEGNEAIPDAPLSGGPVELVLLSHGGLRSADDSGAWLAAALADAGYLAVEVNAPRPDSAAAALDELWRRPQDLTAALDTLLADEDWSEDILRDDISAVGFALGGTAVLSLAGATLDAASVGAACDADLPPPDCFWFEAEGASLAEIDSGPLTEPRRDERIGSVVALGAEYLDMFAGTPEIPALVLTLGPRPAPELIGTEAMPDLSPVDAFPACTEQAPQILEEDGSTAAICGEDPSARPEHHDRIVQRVMTFLQDS